MRNKVSAHSGLPEDTELRMIEERAMVSKAKREAQLSTIYGVLDKMPDVERRTLLAEVVRHYWREKDK